MPGEALAPNRMASARAGATTFGSNMSTVRSYLKFTVCLMAATVIVMAWKIWPFAKRDPIGYALDVYAGAPLIPTWQGKIMKASGQYCTVRREDYPLLFTMQEKNRTAFDYYRESGAILFIYSGSSVRVLKDDGEYVQVRDASGVSCWTLRSRL